MHPFLPPRPFLGSILLRTTVVWAFLRFAAAGLGTTMEIPFPAGLAFSPLRFLWITGFVAGAVLYDLRLHRETLFLANLGVSRARLLTVIVGMCGVLEFLLRMVLRG